MLMANPIIKHKSNLIKALNVHQHQKKKEAIRVMVKLQY